MDRGIPQAEMAQQSTSKVPPFWSPALELKGYPFRKWKRDLEVWVAGTELSWDRQGPAVVQRLGGTARDILSELPIEMITRGRFDMNGAQISTGIEVIIQGLGRRYAQMEVETSIMYIVELITFRRNGYESIDDAIARFETVSARAADDRAGFVMPVAAGAWLFLEAMKILRPVWSLLFQPFGGNLPTTPDQMTALLHSIRQQSHITEHTHSGPRDFDEGWKGRDKGKGKGHYLTDYAEWDDSQQQNSYFGDEASAWNHLESYLAGGSSQDTHWENPDQNEWQEDPVGYDGDWPYCQQCCSYLYEEHEDEEDTDTDDEPDMTQWTSYEVQEYLGEMEANETYENLKQMYLVHKRRFRHFASRGARKHRFPRKGNWSLSMKGAKGGKGSYFGKNGSVLNMSSLAGRKGKGKGGKGKKSNSFMSQGNPKGADGEIMKCHECGSTEHLVARCSKRKGGGKGKGKGGGKHFATGLNCYNAQLGVLNGLIQDHWFSDQPKALQDNWEEIDLTMGTRLTNNSGPQIFEIGGDDEPAE